VNVLRMCSFIVMKRLDSGDGNGSTVWYSDRQARPSVQQRFHSSKPFTLPIEPQVKPTGGFGFNFVWLLKSGSLRYYWYQNYATVDACDAALAAQMFDNPPQTNPVYGGEAFNATVRATLSLSITVP
jgi:hypothetical protein